MTENINEKDLELTTVEAAEESAAEATSPESAEVATETSDFLAEAKAVLDEESEAASPVEDNREETVPETQVSEPEEKEAAIVMEAADSESEETAQEEEPEDDPEEESEEESEAKPARKTRTRGKKKTEPEEQAEEDADPAPVSQQRPVMSEAERRRANAARRRQRVRRLLSEAPLDERGEPINSGDSLTSVFDEDYAEISRQFTRHEILSGVIESIRRRPGGMGWVETSNRDFRVLIPFSELDLQIGGLDRLSDDDKWRRQYAEVSAMMGATIHYMITDIDKDNRLIAGSCAAANKIRREKSLNRKDIDGNYMVYVGRQVTGTILSVFEKLAFVDVYGFRARIRNADISADYTENANDVLYPGQTVKLFVKEIERDENGNVTRLFVSMRDDKREREMKAKMALTIKKGEQYLGRVINLTSKVIFVRLNIGLTAMVYISNGIRGRRVPGIGETVSISVLSVEENRNSGTPIIHGRLLRSINFNAR